MSGRCQRARVEIQKIVEGIHLTWLEKFLALLVYFTVGRTAVVSLLYSVHCGKRVHGVRRVALLIEVRCIR